MKKLIPYIIIFLLVCVILFQYHKPKETIVITKTDTIQLTDTICNTKYLFSTTYDTIISYVVDTDTIMLPIELEQKHICYDTIFQDTNYNANLEVYFQGVNPCLDSIKFNMEYKYTQNEIKCDKQRKNGQKLGIFIGPSFNYGYNGKNFVPTIGISIGWGLNISK